MSALPFIRRSRTSRFRLVVRFPSDGQDQKTDACRTSCSMHYSASASPRQAKSSFWKSSSGPRRDSRFCSARPGRAKRLLLDCVAGLAKPDAGRIAIGDRILFDADARHRSSRGQAPRRIRVSEPCPVPASDRGAERPVRPRAFAAGGACVANVGNSSGISNCSSRAALSARNFRRREPAHRVSPNSGDRSRRAASGRTAGRARRRRPNRRSSTICASGTRLTAFRSFM